MKRILIMLAAVFCCVMNITMLTSCDKMDGMNESTALYSYRAQCHDFDYQDAEGPFTTAIRFSVGLDPIRGGADDQVIDACNACYDNLKEKLDGRSGKVLIFKIRHPDGKLKVLKEYKF